MSHGETLIWDVVHKATWLAVYEEQHPDGIDPDDPEYIELCEEHRAAINAAIAAIQAKDAGPM